MGQAVGGDHLAVAGGCTAGGDALQQFKGQLGDGVDLAVCIVQQTAAAGIGAADETAQTDVLHVKAGGLVFDVPLLFKGEGKAVDEADQLGIILVGEAAQLVRPLADSAANPSELQVLAQIFLAAHFDVEAEKVLQKFLKAAPDASADMWIELAKIQHRSGRRTASQQSFIAGYRLDQKRIFERLQKDQELYELAAPLFQKK